MKKVSIVIVDYKNKQDTKDCIVSLEKLLLADIDVSVVLVNNDIEEIYSKSMFSSSLPLHIINSTLNSGFSGGCNSGIRYALSKGAEYIMLLNHDTIVDPSLLIELIHAYESQNACGLVSPKIYFAKGHEFSKGRYTKEQGGKVIWYAGGVMDWKNVLGRHRGVDEVDSGQFDTTEETDFATGCCMLFSSAGIQKIGLFDEKYFLYYEDSDLNERMKRRNFKILYAPKAVLWHKNAGSTGGSGSTLHDYYISRNRMLFGMRYAPWRSKFALFKESIRLLARGRVWQKAGIRDYYKGRFGKGSYRS